MELSPALPFLVVFYADFSADVLYYIYLNILSNLLVLLFCTPMEYDVCQKAFKIIVQLCIDKFAYICIYNGEVCKFMQMHTAYRMYKVRA